MAVNVSPRHLADVAAARPARRDALEAEGLPGSALTLEVTENSIMSDPARAGDVLRRIRDLGIAVSIDDFGTGYSSLAYLRDLSATEVKIDKTFVLNASTNERDLAIVKAAVDLGHSLGLQVVAEGVEDDDDRSADGRQRLRPPAGLPHPAAGPGRRAARVDLRPQLVGGEVVRLPERGRRRAADGSTRLAADR